MKKLFLVFASLFFIAPSFAQRAPVMEFFHGAECPHCHAEKAWFPELQELYPDLEIREYEVWHDQANQAVWHNRMRKLGLQAKSVPTNIIGDEVVIGFQSQEILSLLEKHFGPPANPNAKPNQPVKGEEDRSWEKYLSFSWPVMSLTLGFIDGFNPCAMWSLLVLIGFLLGLEKKSHRWLIGGVFVGSSAILYFLALLAYLLGFEAITAFVASSLMTWIFRAVGLFSVITGAFIFKNSFDAKLDCEVRDMKGKAAFHQKLKAILERKNLWLILIGVIGLAFSVNAVELLCSFAIPTAFTATLVAADMSWMHNLTALALYDAAYIFDDVLVLVIALWTMNLKIFSPKMVQYSHFIGGILLFVLGIFLILNPSWLTSLFA